MSDIERAMKLLALTESPNANEAGNAARIVCKMLREGKVSFAREGHSVPRDAFADAAEAMMELKKAAKLVSLRVAIGNKEPTRVVINGQIGYVGACSCVVQCSECKLNIRDGDYCFIAVLLVMHLNCAAAWCVQ